MRHHLIQFLICMLLCTAGLLAADTQATARPEEAYNSYESKLSDDKTDLSETLLLLSKSDSDGNAVASQDANRSEEESHGQPLPGLFFSVFLAGLLMNTATHLRRRSVWQRIVLARTNSSLFNRFIEFTHFSRTNTSPYTCCWEWQQTVLRL